MKKRDNNHGSMIPLHGLPMGMLSMDLLRMPALVEHDLRRNFKDCLKSVLSIPANVIKKGKKAIEMYFMAMASKVFANPGPWCKFMPVQAWYYFITCKPDKADRVLHSLKDRTYRPVTVCLLLWPNSMVTRGISLVSNDDLNAIKRLKGRQQAFRYAWLAKDQPHQISFPVNDKIKTTTVALFALSMVTEFWVYQWKDKFYKGFRFMPGMGALTTYEQSLIKSYRDREAKEKAALADHPALQIVGMELKDINLKGLQTGRTPCDDPFRHMYPCKLTPAPHHEDTVFIAEFRDIPEAITEGGTIEEALHLAADALHLALTTYQERGIPIPLPSDKIEGEYLVTAKQIPPTGSSEAAMMMVQGLGCTCGCGQGTATEEEFQSGLGGCQNKGD